VAVVAVAADTSCCIAPATRPKPWECAGERPFGRRRPLCPKIRNPRFAPARARTSPDSPQG